MASAEDVAMDGAGDSDATLLLRVLIPQLWRRPDADRLALRACCREARRIATSATEQLAMRDYPVYPDDDVVAGLRGLLAGGCRPTRLKLSVSHRASPPPFGLRLLTELRAVSPPALTALELAGLPLTAAVVRAIGLVAPRLSALTLERYNPALSTGRPGGQPARPTRSGVQGLLRLAAPHLQRLSLLSALGMSAPAAAAHWADLGAALRQCSRLESLVLGDTVPVLPRLPALRSLELWLPWFRQGKPPLALPGLRSLKVDLPNLESEPPRVLPSLTQLTRLVLSGATKHELAAALPAVRGMRGLADLHLEPRKLRPSQMRQLADLTTLTRLYIAGIHATDGAAPPGGGAEVAAGVPGPAAQPVVPRVPLPAQLRVLVLRAAPSLSEATALGLPSLPAGPLQLRLPGIRVTADDMDADGRLSSPAAAALLAACGQLQGRLCTGAEDLHSGAAQGDGSDGSDDSDEPPFTLDLGHAAAPASWPDQYGTLFAALQPLALRKLRLASVALGVMDVHALTQHLPLLETLCLACAVEVPAVPLLRRLKRLAYVELHPGRGGALVSGWDSEAAVRAALLALCVDAPSLKNVYLDVADADLLDAAAKSVDWLENELPRLRDRPPTVGMGCNSEELMSE